MQFEINTQSKTIKLISSIKTSELKKLKEFIGEDWTNYTIESASTQYIYTNYPWYVNVPYINTYPTWTTCTSASSITGTSLVSTTAENAFYIATN